MFFRGEAIVVEKEKLEFWYKTGRVFRSLGSFHRRELNEVFICLNSWHGLLQPCSMRYVWYRITNIIILILMLLWNGKSPSAPPSQPIRQKQQCLQSMSNQFLKSIQAYISPCWVVCDDPVAFRFRNADRGLRTGAPLLRSSQSDSALALA